MNNLNYDVFELFKGMYQHYGLNNNIKYDNYVIYIYLDDINNSIKESISKYGPFFDVWEREYYLPTNMLKIKIYDLSNREEYTVGYLFDNKLHFNMEYLRNINQRVDILDDELFFMIENIKKSFEPIKLSIELNKELPIKNNKQEEKRIKI